MSLTGVVESFKRQVVLTAFEQGVDISIEVLGDAVNMLGAHKRIAEGSSLISMQLTIGGALTKKIVAIQTLSPSKRNTVVIKALRGEIEEIVEDKVKRFKSIVLRDQNLKLTKKKSEKELALHADAFKVTLEDFYYKPLSEGKSPKEGIIAVLARGMALSMANSLNGSELAPGSILAEEIEAFQSKSFLRAVVAAYPVLKEEYLRILRRSGDTSIAIKVIESLAVETITRFTSLVEGAPLGFWDLFDKEEKEIPSSCFPVIEKLLRQAGAHLSTPDNLEAIKTELIENMSAFAKFFS